MIYVYSIKTNRKQLLLIRNVNMVCLTVASDRSHECLAPRSAGIPVDFSPIYFGSAQQKWLSGKNHCRVVVHGKGGFHDQTGV
jgi:hypothetical protein